ncbi:MAG: tagaturonate reductase [Saprospiraceae bacterium]|nr:tagaturonate reductase [Saprospiraceae bacterium]
MQPLTRNTANVPAALPAKILQFGGGNFLRGFVDWMIDVYNEKKQADLGVLVVKPTERGDYQQWRDQEGLFHILTKGLRNGELVNESRLVSCVSEIIHPYKDWQGFLASAKWDTLEYVISNTTESGIRFSADDRKTDAPPKEFPAKLCAWLYHRFLHFNGAESAGLVFIPTELIMDNGVQLKSTILQYADLWELGEDFKNWIEQANTFCNTLVDRIIPGVAKEALAEAHQQVGFEDSMITQGEPYHLWAIEAPAAVQAALPLDQIGLNIIYTNDLTPYRVSKVRILNGAHTSMVPVGYLYGIETVREVLEDEKMGAFVEQCIFDEIIPSLDLPEVDVDKFAKDVLDRFRNPFIRHRLISISLNSISKFKTRVLPSILAYHAKKGQLPKALVFSMAALLHFYKGEHNGQPIELKDDPTHIAFMKDAWAESDSSEDSLKALAQNILKWESAWKQDLTEVSGLHQLLANYLIMIEKEGMPIAVSKFLSA